MGCYDLGVGHGEIVKWGLFGQRFLCQTGGGPKIISTKRPPLWVPLVLADYRQWVHRFSMRGTLPPA